MRTKNFIGAGWAFPMGVSATGGIAMAKGGDELDQAIRLILCTYPGERPMRPEFGCAIHDHVFDPADGRTAGRIAFEVRESLRRWRIPLLLVGVEGGHARAVRIEREAGRGLVIGDPEVEQPGADPVERGVQVELFEQRRRRLERARVLQWVVR